MMIEVSVKLYGRLRDVLPAEMKGETVLKLPATATAGDIFIALNMQDKMAILAINGEDVDDDHPLQNGDKVGIFAPVAGG